jgi:hypothetical protein
LNTAGRLVKHLAKLHKRDTYEKHEQGETGCGNDAGNLATAHAESRYLAA